LRRPWRVSDARPKLLIVVLIIIVLAVAVILAVIINFRRRNENNKNLDWVELNKVVAEALPDAFFLTDFILANELPRLKPSERWYDEGYIKRQVRNGKERPGEWALKAFGIEDFGNEDLLDAFSSGARTVHLRKALIALRKTIRKRRKENADWHSPLTALYRIAALDTLVHTKEQIYDVGMPGDVIENYLSKKEVAAIDIDYEQLGYECMPLLNKTDKKWIIEAWGEREYHSTVFDAYREFYDRGVARLAWGELSERDEYEQMSMEEFLRQNRQMVERFHEQDLANAAARNASLRRHQRKIGSTKSAFKALQAPFVVADIETTGLNAVEDEVIEIGAIRVGSDWNIIDRYSVLIEPTVQIPEEITSLTGISQLDVDRDGVSIADGLAGFKGFVGDLPIFFHHAQFDLDFIQRAAQATEVNFNNPIFDSLGVARRTWPNLENHKLGTLAKHVGCQQASAHRALTDSTTTLAVLQAAVKAVNQ